MLREIRLAATACEAATTIHRRETEQVHGRTTPATRVDAREVSAAPLIPSPRTPDHTNCSPAHIATAATTVFNFCAGILRERPQPRITPGIPPSSNCVST